MKTNAGTIKIKLYEDTPLHSEHFLELAKKGHYDSLLFHRVIENFMIQGGASDSKGASKDKMIGEAAEMDLLEAEIRPEHFHKKGVIAAARLGDEANPGKRSSGEQFYIVHGKTYTDQELDELEDNRLFKAKNSLGAKLYEPKQNEHRRYLMTGQNGKADSLIRGINAEIERQFAGREQEYSFTKNVRDIYKMVGGAPFLDGEYTIFGEVTEGWNIIDKIATNRTGQHDRPVEDIIILETKLRRK